MITQEAICSSILCTSERGRVTENTWVSPNTLDISSCLSNSFTFPYSTFLLLIQHVCDSWKENRFCMLIRWIGFEREKVTFTTLGECIWNDNHYHLALPLSWNHRCASLCGAFCCFPRFMEQICGQDVRNWTLWNERKGSSSKHFGCIEVTEQVSSVCGLRSCTHALALYFGLPDALCLTHHIVCNLGKQQTQEIY